MNNTVVLLCPFLVIAGNFSVTLFYSTLFCCGGKSNLVWFTLFYSTLLTVTHRQKDGRRNQLILGGLGNQKKLVPPSKTHELCVKNQVEFMVQVE